MFAWLEATLPTMHRLLATLLVGVALYSTTGAQESGAQENGAEDRRPYEAGPLAVDDFRGEGDPSTPMMAKTVTVLTYEFRYSYTQSSRATTARLTSIDLAAHIRRDLSWIKQPKNKALLEHEQGHADNAQIQCLKARLAFVRDMKSGAGITAAGSSPKEAVAALDAKLKQRMQAFEKQLQEADAEYDRETMHGLGGEQAQWRRVQMETLKRLTTEWERVSK